MANDYTALDETSILDRAIELGGSRFPDIDWESPLLPDRWILEQLAHIGGKAMFLAGNAARESRWSTAVQRRSQIAHAKLGGVSLRGARAARTTVTFQIVAITAGTVSLPAGTAPRTEEVTDPVRFQLLEDLVVDVVAGTTTAAATVEHSETHEDTLTSTNRPNQEFVLSQTPYLEDHDAYDSSTLVIFANGAYTRVDSFLASGPGDRHFTVTVDNLDRATIRFGNGAAGAIPVGTGTVTYRTGGGLAGNVPAGAIKVLDGSWTDDAGNPVTITVTNVDAAEGGDDRESVAQARERIPRAVQTRVVAISREDYENGALEVAGVARALALTYAEDPTVPQNTVIIYPVPPGGGAPSDSLKTAVKAQFIQLPGYPAPRYRAFQNLDLRVQTPLYTTIDPRVKAYFRSGVTPLAGAAAVRAALADFFAPKVRAARLVELAPDVAKARGITASMGDTEIVNPLVDFGYNLQDADGEPFPGYAIYRIARLIDGLPEVARIAGDSEGLLLNGLAQDVQMYAWGFPVLGNVVVVDAKTGTVL